MTRLAAILLCAVLSSAIACARQPERRLFEVGEHRGEFVVPDGWVVIDQGRQIRLRRDAAEIVLQALGPAGPEGVRREIEQARSAWRLSRRDEARTRLRNVPSPMAWFGGHDEAREPFSRAWQRIISATPETPSVDVEAAFSDLLLALWVLASPDLGSMADTGLATLGHDQRRDVRVRRPVSIGGREAFDVETWNRLSHTDPRRFLFLPDDGYLLAVSLNWQASPDVVAAFESVRDSLQLVPGTTWRR